MLSLADIFGGSSDKSVKPEYFFGLFVKEDSLIGFVLEYIRTDGRLVSVARRRVHLTDGYKQIVEDVDGLLTKLEDESGVKLNQVIFFVLGAWMADDTGENIKKPQVELMRKISNRLDLKNPRYVTCYEAISAQLKEKNVKQYILVELTFDQVSLYVFAGDEKIYQSNMERSEDFLGDVEMMLYSANSKHKVPLPHKLYFYSTDADDDFQEKISHYKWQEDIFGDVPKVEVLVNKDLYESFIRVFETELNAENKQLKPVKKSIVDSEEDSEAQFEKAQLQEDEKEFVKEKEHKKHEDLQSLGFVIGGDIAQIAPRDSVLEPDLIIPQRSVLRRGFMRKAPLLKADVTEFKPKRKTPVWLWVSFGVVIVIVMVLVTVELFFHKAKVTLFLPTQKINKSIDFNVDFTKDNNLGVKQKIFSVDVKATKPTSGSEIVGERAEGKVFLHNFSDEAKLIEAGTRLTVDGLGYIIQTDAEIPPSFEIRNNGEIGKSPGRVVATIKAEAIGSKYNLSVGKRFTIDGLPVGTYFALNNDEISGGTQKSINAVTEKDILELKKNLKDNALKELNKKSQGLDKNLKIFEDLTEITTPKSEINKKIGEEAEKITGEATVKISYYGYDEAKLKSEIVKKLREELKDGYELDLDNLRISFGDLNKNDNYIEIKVLADAKAFKIADKNAIAGKLAGKTKTEAEFIAKEQMKAEKVYFEGGTFLPFFADYLPFFPMNIECEIKVAS